MPVPELETEMQYFEEIRSELLKTAFGKFAVIKGRECLGTFDTQENAYNEGAREFGTEPFLIVQVLPEDPIQEMPAYCLGLIHAGI